MKASPQFLGPMRHVKGSVFKQGTLQAPFTELPPLEEKPAEQAERFVPFTLAFAAIVVLGGPLGCRGLHTFFAWGQFWEVLTLVDSEVAARVSGAAETVDYFG